MCIGQPPLISDFRMIILVYLLPNTSGVVCAKNLRKWAEKAFTSSIYFNFPWYSKRTMLIKTSKESTHALFFIQWYLALRNAATHQTTTHIRLHIASSRPNAPESIRSFLGHEAIIFFSWLALTVQLLLIASDSFIYHNWTLAEISVDIRHAE
jgi:hypothetical protein